ncbi:MAG: inositol monophosphatase [Muribaculaceae bacterium]|nr:inositol monophosphatase [Muribaculaceae bacterium]
MERWAREAGDIQLRYFRSTHLDISEKLNAFDVVTTADKESERYLIGKIRTAYPDHSILSEESGSDSRKGEWRWIIDPLDGTTNFSSGLPVFSVSIGLEHRGKVVAGVVFAPYLNELFKAIKGKGATMNGRPIRCSDKSQLATSVLATGVPYDKDRNPDNNLDNICRLAVKVRGIRRYGSAAMDLCYVAAGYLDGYWEMGINIWDVAAGQLIATEAGAKTVSFRNDRNIAVIAANPALLDILRKEIQ